MQQAHDFFQTYLASNMEEADTLERMRSVLAEFSARAPKVVVMKGMDGRVHGSRAKGQV